jgi:hypothetical protein
MECLNAENRLLRGGRAMSLVCAQGAPREVGALTDGLTLDVLAVTLTLLSLVAGTSFAGDDRTMEFIESYRGYRITVTTVRTSDAGWTASAKIVMSDDKTVTVRPDPTDNPAGKFFHSEEDAKAAALRAAVTAIDRGRVSIGKP